MSSAGASERKRCEAIVEVVEVGVAEEED